MSMARVLESAQAYGRVDETAVGRLAALRGAALPEDVVRKGAGHDASAGAHASGDGREGTLLRRSYAVGIEGLTEPEAEALLKFLVAHITQPAFTCRLRWEAKTFVLWDNRICIHQAFNDYDGYRREMYRRTVAGEVPV